jgi:hypothetical protein
MQGECPVQYVGVGVDNSGNDGASVKVDDVLSPPPARVHDLIRTNGIDPGSRDGERLSPGHLGIARINVAMKKQGVARKNLRWADQGARASCEDGAADYRTMSARRVFKF